MLLWITFPKPISPLRTRTWKGWPCDRNLVLLKEFSPTHLFKLFATTKFIMLRHLLSHIWHCATSNTSFINLSSKKLSLHEHITLFECLPQGYEHGLVNIATLRDNLFLNSQLELLVFRKRQNLSLWPFTEN